MNFTRINFANRGGSNTGKPRISAANLGVLQDGIEEGITKAEGSVIVPQLRVYSDVAISVNNATPKALPFNQERYDLGTTAGQHSVTAQTDRLICQRAGLYHIGASAWFLLPTPFNINTVRELYMEHTAAVDGAVTRIESVATPPNASYSTRLPLATDWRMAVGDTIRVLAWQDSGGIMFIETFGAASPEAWWHRVSA